MIQNCSRCGTAHRRSHRWCADCHASYMRDWRKKNPLTEEQRIKDRARSYASVYLKRGLITRGPCRDCGTDDAQMHHEDYSRPIDITWLCRDCHLALHAGK